MISAIIVAAGSSRRMGSDKMFTSLAGHPVVWHSMRAFQDTREIDEIIIVCKESQIPDFRALAKESKFKKVTQVVAGGTERHLSVWNGLQAVQGKESEFVAIHDGARPLTT